MLQLYHGHFFQFIWLGADIVVFVWSNIVSDNKLFENTLRAMLRRAVLDCHCAVQMSIVDWYHVQAYFAGLDLFVFSCQSWLLIVLMWCRNQIQV